MDGDHAQALPQDADLPLHRRRRQPPHGSNFAEQCRVAAKHKAGVRITNEASNYALNFALTRWVASAGKHYGAYYGFEPAGGVDENGIVARIYNATASGANQLFDYNAT